MFFESLQFKNDRYKNFKLKLFKNVEKAQF